MRVILGALIWLIVILLLGLPLAILAVIKLISVTIYGYCCNCSGNYGKLKPVNKLEVILSTDSSWIRPLVNVGFALEVGGDVELEGFRKHFERCFNLGEGEKEPYEGFFSYLVKRGGYTFRACSKSSLVLEENIVERRMEDGEKLEEFLARWCLERSYGERRACWEIAVVPLPPSPSKRTAILFKMHHGLCDGYSMVHILDKLLGTKAPYLVKDFQKGFWGTLGLTMETPFNMSRIGGIPMEHPFKVTLPPPGPERKDLWMFSFTSFPLEDMKTLRRKNGGVHMISVIWTIITGALRRFLEEEKPEMIPEFIGAATTLPWPRHPSMSENAPAKDKVCNHWTSDMLKAPLREPDPLIRLQQIEKEYLTVLYHCQDKYGKQAIFSVFSVMPAFLTEAAMTKDSGVPCALTSLIGGDGYTLLGHPVERLHPFLCAPDNVPFIPLSNFTFSHGGKVELTMGANPLSIYKDQQTLDKICHKYCHEEFESFLQMTK